MTTEQLTLRRKKYNRWTCIISLVAVLFSAGLFFSGAPFPLHFIPWTLFMLASYWLGRTEECHWHEHHSMSSGEHRS